MRGGPGLSLGVICVDASRSLPWETLDDFLATVAAPAKRLALEILESQLATRDQDVCTWFHRLADCCVRLNVDDLTAEPESLDLLSGLPLSGVKLTKPLLVDVERSEYRSRYVEGILGFARKMDFDVMASCVDTEAQRRWPICGLRPVPSVNRG